MGSCLSSSSANYIQEPLIKTSKIVCMDGSLIEFSIPITVSTILGNDSSSFVCNADGLNYDEYIQALREDEYVVPGKLYFVLPLELMKKPVTGGDMAALAVKATSALSKTDFVETEMRKGNNRIMPFVEGGNGDDYKKRSSSLRFSDGYKKKRGVRWIRKVQLSAISESTLVN